MDLREFLARSTDREFEETTLAKVLAGLPSLSACNGCLATLLRATADNPSLNTEIAYVD